MVKVAKSKLHLMLTLVLSYESDEVDHGFREYFQVKYD